MLVELDVELIEVTKNPIGQDGPAIQAPLSASDEAGQLVQYDADPEQLEQEASQATQAVPLANVPTGQVATQIPLLR